MDRSDRVGGSDNTATNAPVGRMSHGVVRAVMLLYDMVSHGVHDCEPA